MPFARPVVLPLITLRFPDVIRSLSCRLMNGTYFLLCVDRVAFFDPAIGLNRLGGFAAVNFGSVNSLNSSPTSKDKAEAGHWL